MLKQNILYIGNKLSKQGNTPTGIDNIFPNNKQLINIVDLLGRESKDLKNQPLFYIYDDGTVEKKIILE